jgi:hypothetical protein
MFFMCNYDLAPIWRKIEALFPFEEEVFRRKQIGIQAASQSFAPKRAETVQRIRVNKDSPLTVIFVVDEIEQCPCGNAVKIPFGPQIKIAIADY